MLYENVTININRYNELKNKADFFDSNYIAVHFEFLGNNSKKLWTKDEILKEIEDYHNKRMVEYKDKIRSKFTLKFWRWRILFKSSK